MDGDNDDDSRTPDTVNQNYKNIDCYYITDKSFNQKPKYQIYSMYAVPNIVVFCNSDGMISEICNCL